MGGSEIDADAAVCSLRGAREVAVGVALVAVALVMLDADLAYLCVELPLVLEPAPPATAAAAAAAARRGVTVREVVAEECEDIDEDDEESDDSTDGDGGYSLAGSERRLLLSLGDGESALPFPFARPRARGLKGVAVCVDDVDVEDVEGVGDAVRDDVGVCSAEGNLGVGIEGRLLFAASVRKARNEFTMCWAIQNQQLYLHTSHEKRCILKYSE